MPRWIAPRDTRDVSLTSNVWFCPISFSCVTSVLRPAYIRRETKVAQYDVFSDVNWVSWGPRFARINSRSRANASGVTPCDVDCTLDETDMTAPSPPRNCPDSNPPASAPTGLAGTLDSKKLWYRTANQLADLPGDVTSSANTSPPVR
eukprot:scaffold245_cov256-Pinguiococcus_pyrenoidosus.AAC.16